MISTMFVLHPHVILSRTSDSRILAITTESQPSDVRHKLSWRSFEQIADTEKGGRGLRWIQIASECKLNIQIVHTQWPHRPGKACSRQFVVPKRHCAI